MRVAIIPARGGSRRIPKKAIRDFRGRPIIAYSIQAALDSKLFHRVIVSTDSDDIALVAQAHDADVLRRPCYLAVDDVGTQDVMRHALAVMDDVEQACCIYPCAPMILASDLLRGWQLLHRPGAVYSVPVGQWLADPGSFYWGWAWAFRENVPLLAEHTVMVPIDPRRAIDINVEDDWQRAERAYAELHGEGG